ncbi:GDSL esterase/lipase 1-like [Abrus precatorius]|uniref:GDSL esterase/lipase 1-like n=1 Tax=Abrus precatorius TaxID=3816 RepID=A0A8B8K123_ABRPR|nr:GDSL esterase/lipase 1-like [Abrus precatorius]
MARLRFVLCAILILLNTINSNAAGPNQKTLFVFGDSLFDPGNNQYLNSSMTVPSTRWPYGETYFKNPTGRFSDGRLVPDFIAQFANLPILAPYLQHGAEQFIHGTNFASAGAGVLAHNDSTINLSTQLNHFKAVVKSLRQKLGDKKVNRVLNNAVYLFSMGGNDYFSLLNQNLNVTQSYQTQYVKMVIGSLTNTLKEVYILGGRKIAFQNVGPLGCVPIARERNPQVGGSCDEVASAMARQHNKALSVALKKLESTLPGFKYSMFDYYSALLDKVNNPSKYGFKEGKEACCGHGAYGAFGCGGGFSGKENFEVCHNTAEYVWFDGAHTTERANRQLAELIWNGPPMITGPYTVKQLFGYTK